MQIVVCGALIGGTFCKYVKKVLKLISTSIYVYRFLMVFNNLSNL